MVGTEIVPRARVHIEAQFVGNLHLYAQADGGGALQPADVLLPDFRASGTGDGVLLDDALLHGSAGEGVHGHEAVGDEIVGKVDGDPDVLDGMFDVRIDRFDDGPFLGVGPVPSVSYFFLFL